MLFHNVYQMVVFGGFDILVWIWVLFRFGDKIAAV